MTEKNSTTGQAARTAQTIDVAQHALIISITAARAIGASRASDWRRRGDNATAPAAAWRACCFADLVNDTRNQGDFLQVLAAWEQGFDSVLPPAGQHQLDRIDRLSSKAMQLAAMLRITYGAGFASFREWSDDIQDNYLWACADTADEISALAEAVEVGPAAHCARRAT